MLDRVSNRVAIIDFGLAAMKGVSTLPMQSRDACVSIVGSPAWFAPEFHVAEQLTDLKEEGRGETADAKMRLRKRGLCGSGFARSPAIDIWGAGAVLLHLLTGTAWGARGCCGKGSMKLPARCTSTLLGMDCKGSVFFCKCVLPRPFCTGPRDWLMDHKRPNWQAEPCVALCYAMLMLSAAASYRLASQGRWQHSQAV